MKVRCHQINLQGENLYLVHLSGNADGETVNMQVQTKDLSAFTVGKFYEVSFSPTA